MTTMADPLDSQPRFEQLNRSQMEKNLFNTGGRAFPTVSSVFRNFVYLCKYFTLANNMRYIFQDIREFYYYNLHNSMKHKSSRSISKLIRTVERRSSNNEIDRTFFRNSKNVLIDHHVFLYVVLIIQSRFYSI